MNYISHDINGYAFTLFGSNWSNSCRTLTLFMKAIIKYEKESGNKVYRELFNDALKYTNCFGGIYIIDACDDEFVIENIYFYVSSRFDERKKEAEYNKLNNVRTSGVEKFDNIVKAINKIGGTGSLSQINEAYSEIIGKELSQAQKDYIKESIDEHYIESNSFKGNCVFYRIQVGEKTLWKVANDYLIKDNYYQRNEYTNTQIESLEDKENLLFNTINSIRGEKISIDDIKGFKQQIILNYNDIENFDGFVKENINKLCKRGLLEKIDASLYKKTFRIKIK